MLKAAVVGATGYAGSQMVRLLTRHPSVEIAALCARSSAGDRYGEHVPDIPQCANMIIRKPEISLLNSCDLVVFALPHGASSSLAQQIADDVMIIDLSADHRLERQEDWQHYYGDSFAEPWVYGMPELLRVDLSSNDDNNPAGIVNNQAKDSIPQQRSVLAAATRIASPGCNVTAVTLGIQPALAHGLIETNDIVADLAVGYSGAGKALNKPHLLAAEAFGAAVAYSVGGTHRHIPEILQNLRHAARSKDAQHSNNDIRLTMTPILVPMDRGILAVISAPLRKQALERSDEQIHEIWQQVYRDESFITVLPYLSQSSAIATQPSSKWSVGTNAAYMQICVDRRSSRLVVTCTIDNLIKGTAGQAIQAMNIALGMSETTGLVAGS